MFSLFAMLFQPLWADAFGKFRNGVVCVETRVALASKDRGQGGGTAWIIDADQGYLVTNAHVARGDGVSSSELITEKGRRQINAHHVWSHPYLDLSIMKVAPDSMEVFKKEVTALKLQTKLPKLGDKIKLIGYSERNSFTEAEGSVANVNESSGFFPVQSIRISVADRGGFSGAPVLDQNGDVLAVVFSRSQNSLWAIPSAYLKDIVDQVKKGQTVTIADPGFVTDFMEIDTAVKNYNFPKDLADGYSKKYPDSFSRILFTKSSGRDDILPGDIIYAVDGQEVGPSHILLSQLLNQALGCQKKVKITVYRQGEKKDIAIALTSAFMPNRFIRFAGSTIHECNETWSFLLGIPKGVPLITSIEPGSLFHQEVPPHANNDVYAIVPVAINGKPVTTFENLQATLTQLIHDKKKDFNVTFKSFGAHVTYNQEISIRRDPISIPVSFKTPGDYSLEIFTRKSSKDGDTWDREAIA